MWILIFVTGLSYVFHCFSVFSGLLCLCCYRVFNMCVGLFLLLMWVNVLLGFCFLSFLMCYFLWVSGLYVFCVLCYMADCTVIELVIMVKLFVWFTCYWVRGSLVFWFTVFMVFGQCFGF